jgi:hypothetical protein
MADSFSACTTVSKHIVMGNQRVAIGTWTLGAASSSTNCGMKFVNFAMVTPQSAGAAASSLCYIVTSGVINVTSAVTGYKYNVVAWGR